MNLGDPIDVLARTIYGEARGEGARGMQAVANVVLNRCAQPSWWGHDILTVCLKPRQFSAWDQGDPNLEKLQQVTDADPVFQTAVDIATQAVDGSLPDLTKGGDHYQVIGTGAAWSKGKPISAIVGRHEFYALGPEG